MENGKNCNAGGLFWIKIRLWKGGPDENCSPISLGSLDGAGCVINVMNAIPKSCDYIWKASGYGKVDKIMDELGKSGFDVFFVTDLNFNEEQFRRLGSFKKKNNKIIYIDHHAYPKYDVEELGQELGITVVWDRRFSGTHNTFNYLDGFNKLPKLKELTTLVDTYDLWKKEDPDFEKAHAFNDLFWEYSMYKFIDRFKRGYILTDEDIEVMRKKRKERKTYLKDSYDNFSTINEEEKILFIMNPTSNFTNDFTIYYPDFDVYLILLKAEEDKYQFSVRIKENVGLTIKSLDSIIAEKVDFPYSFGGHDITGGLTVPADHLQEFMDAFNDAVAEGKKPVKL